MWLLIWSTLLLTPAFFLTYGVLVGHGMSRTFVEATFNSWNNKLAYYRRFSAITKLLWLDGKLCAWIAVLMVSVTVKMFCRIWVTFVSTDLDNTHETLSSK